MPRLVTLIFLLILNFKGLSFPKPKVVLKGDGIVHVCRWYIYKDEGFVIKGGAKKSLEISRIDTLGTYCQNFTSKSGMYYLQYKVTFRSGAVAYSEKRCIEVYKAENPKCTSPCYFSEFDDTDQYKFKLYPNPSSGQLTMDLQFKKRERLRIYIVNVYGNTIRKIYFGSLKNKKFNINLSSEVNGVYLVNYEFLNKSITITKRIEITK